MKTTDINIRDPFILNENGVFYLYGTRAKNFGKGVSGFDVYTSTDLKEWSSASECFNSAQNGLNRGVNWAPEVYRYKGAYYMFATFTRENGLRGTYVLKANNPMGPFKKHSKGAVTPYDWECLDGTLYIDESGSPYLIFCHEHTQIIDGAVCYIRLNDDLSESIGAAQYIFSGSTPDWADKKPEGEHYITDGPFVYNTTRGSLIIIWSTFVNNKYAQCVAKSDNGKISGRFSHPKPIITNDGGHGMIFKSGDNLILTYHTPNKSGYEHPAFKLLEDVGNDIILKP